VTSRVIVFGLLCSRAERIPHMSSKKKSVTKAPPGQDSPHLPNYDSPNVASAAQQSHSCCFNRESSVRNGQVFIVVTPFMCVAWHG
jgi:hypothetical protein